MIPNNVHYGQSNGRYKHGGKHTRLYRVWESMRKRCRNPNDKSFKNYGARGIRVAPEWEDFDQFFQWSVKHGYADELTIDRINNDGDYSPSNCRWVGYKQQNNNQRNTIRILYNGTTKTLHEWCDELGLPVSRTYYRIRSGMSARQAFCFTRSEAVMFGKAQDALRQK